MMQEMLQDYLSAGAPAEGLALHYRIGDDFSGETDFRLHSDGRYELTSSATQGRKRKQYVGGAGAGAFQTLASAMLKERLWEVTHPRPHPGEDDPPAIIEVETPEQTFAVTLWVSEIRLCPAFGRVQTRILDLIHTLSSGEVLESGR